MAETTMNDLPDRIEETFRGQTILLTGGTGFLGKVLLERFLRCFPGIMQIFILIRGKKGKEPKERLDEIFKLAIFDKAREQRGLETFYKMITPIQGDVMLPGLGISKEDRKILIDKVTIVYHAAATVRFDELLKKAVLLNTRGTQQIVELAKEIKNLEFFAYMSTSYCHLEEKILEEKFYPSPADPYKIIKCIEWMDDDVVIAATTKILGNNPNTYAFTKALSERIIEDAIPHIPAIILRPSIIIPIWKEPLPGWTDNINGPTGLLIGAGKGVIRSMYGNENNYADYVPVDVLVNAIVVTTWNFISCKDHRRIFNLTSSSDLKVSWKEILELAREITKKVPLNNIVWYPDGSIKSSRLYHNFCMFVFLTIPTFLIDSILYLLRYEPIIYKIRNRILKGLEVFEYYINNQWDFVNTNITEVRDKLNTREFDTYYLHGTDINLYEYFENCVHVARTYILNEPIETLPAARRHFKRMYWVDIFTKIFLLALLVYFLFSWISN